GTLPVARTSLLDAILGRPSRRPGLTWHRADAWEPSEASSQPSMARAVLLWLRTIARWDLAYEVASIGTAARPGHATPHGDLPEGP
ncbi:MAG: hypothetical protein ABJG45_09945, partial [Rhodopirellula bahusiensis]